MPFLLYKQRGVGGKNYLGCDGRWRDGGSCITLAVWTPLFLFLVFFIRSLLPRLWPPVNRVQWNLQKCRQLLPPPVPSWTPEGSVQPYVHPSLRRPQIFGARPYLRENAAAAVAIPIKGTWRKGRTGNKISPFSSPPLPNQGRRKQKRGKERRGQKWNWEKVFLSPSCHQRRTFASEGKEKTFLYYSPSPLFGRYFKRRNSRLLLLPPFFWEWPLENLIRAVSTRASASMPLRPLLEGDTECGERWTPVSNALFPVHHQARPEKGEKPDLKFVNVTFFKVFSLPRFFPG